LAKVRIWARLARAVFNGFGIGTLAGMVIHGLWSGVNALTGEMVVNPTAGFLITFFMFFAGSIGIELSKDVEETQKQG